MALSNLHGWSNGTQAPTACGSACGSGDKPEVRASACGSGDKPEEKPTACGSACGSGDK